MNLLFDTSRKLGKGKSSWNTILANKHIYIMLIPVMLVYIVFHYVPMYGLFLAFKSYKGSGIVNFLFGGDWEGTRYFEQIFGDPLFFRALWNTIIISLMNLGIMFPFVIFLVLMLNELRSLRIKKLTQTILYLPHFLSWVVVGSITISLLGSQGAITAFLSFFKREDSVLLLTNRGAFRWILLCSNIIKESGWDTVIFLAAIAGISPELYEAADIDGAGRFKKIWHVTLPCMFSTICIMLLLKISFMLNGNFEQVFMMYNPTVYPVADIIDTYLYRTGLSDGRFSMATAMGLFKSFVGIVLLTISNRISVKLTGSGIY